MQSSTSTLFVSCAVANGLASALSLAAAMAGHWMAALAALATSLLFAAGMIPGIGKR